MRGDFPHPPDGVAFPASEDELRSVLAWCGERDVAVVPVGGGTSAAHEATHGARRPASHRPSAERVTHSAASEADASSRTSRSDQRIGCSSSSSRPSAARKSASRAASPSCAGEPRSSSAAIASSAASERAAGGSKVSSRQRLAT